MKQSNEFAPAVGGGCGARLATARQAAGLAPEDVASRLRMPLRVVRALEADDASVLGAPVFVRGQLRSYARLLDLDIESELSCSGVAVVTRPS
ncbi:MAG: helix-turn-helix domain-containing protein [Lysobacter sp.]|nr:helix-turn-helix domain-containing protein [Lysobacter sp.]